VPSFNLYRGSLLALLVGAALAVWLIVQPTGDDAESSLGPTVITPTPTSVQPTQPVGASPEATEPVEGTVPAGATTPEPTQVTATEPAAGAGEYTVESGDTLSSICAAVGPVSLSLGDCVEEVKRLNGLDSDVISVGQVLTIPQ
jgi:LysM repeat protein